jgi:hypothetical protein
VNRTPSKARFADSTASFFGLISARYFSSSAVGLVWAVEVVVCVVLVLLPQPTMSAAVAAKIASTARRLRGLLVGIEFLSSKE